MNAGFNCKSHYVLMGRCYRILRVFFLQITLLTFLNVLTSCWSFIVCRYHEACDKAREKVLELLRELSAELQNNINVLVFASMSHIISKALFSHVR